MTPHRLRRARLCSALHDLTRRMPLVQAEHGPPTRRFESGPLMVTVRMRDDWVILEAWLHGEGKVASFRVIPHVDHWGTLFWRPGTLAQWDPVVAFERGVLTEAA